MKEAVIKISMKGSIEMSMREVSLVINPSIGNFDPAKPASVGTNNLMHTELRKQIRDFVLSKLSFKERMFSRFAVRIQAEFHLDEYGVKHLCDFGEFIGAHEITVLDCSDPEIPVLKKHLKRHWFSGSMIENTGRNQEPTLER